MISILSCSIGRVIYGAPAYRAISGALGGLRQWRNSAGFPSQQAYIQVPLCRSYRMTPRCEARSPIPVPLDQIDFSFTRSSGPGGQNVNKVSVASRGPVIAFFFNRRQNDCHHFSMLPKGWEI